MAARMSLTAEIAPGLQHIGSLPVITIPVCVDEALRTTAANFKLKLIAAGIN